MSFFRNRRRSQFLFPEMAERPASVSSTFLPTGSSIKSTGSIRRRISTLSSSIIRSKLSTKHRSPSSTAVGHTVDFPSTRYGSESPSPTPSLDDIRMPTGLGRRASIMRPSISPTEPSPTLLRVDSLRHRSVSSPELPTFEYSTWPDVLASLEEDGQPEATCAIAQMPPELLTIVFSAASRTDIASLARVSRLFLAPALRALYADLDLTAISDERAGQCISLIASKRIIGGFARTFACRSFQNPKGRAVALTTVTFAIALTNMHQLQSLTLPLFEASLLFHTTFRLRRLSILSETLSPDEVRDLLSWLASQPSLLSLSLPNLALTTFDYYTEDSQHENRSDCADNTPGSEPDTPNRTLPPHLLPRLTYFHGPPSVAAAIVPGRPIESMVLHVNTTLYDGLRPSAVMSALTRASVPLKHLSIKSASTKIDARTFERVLMSAGSELGDDLQSLAVHWVLEDEFLYKQILTVLPRFRALRTLRLHRDSPPPPPSSPPPNSPLPSSPPPTSPLSPTALSSPLLFPPSPMSRPGSASSVGRDLPLPRAHERSNLHAWQKQCPTLRSVVFLSGAEWRVHVRPSAYANLAAPSFAFVGFVDV